MNYRLFKLPFMYLGLTLGENPTRSSTWKLVLYKIKKKLTSWRNRLLSLAGRVCLLKFVISVIPLFYLSLFKFPALVVRQILKLQRILLWGNKFGEKRLLQ
ncbi:hypothetical protein Fmac_016165 [Flemingia macrophylla]|uniref:Uncharacterized protein n=1 Tax=Flemingia macrophylla TaxID=520843 RepID=A0ABD1MHB6_9FABA